MWLRPVPTPSNTSFCSPMGKKSKAAGVPLSKTPLPPPIAAVPAPLKPQPLPTSEDKESDDGSDDDTDGIDEKGMKRLMELLGDDALDELGAAQLDALKAANEVSEDSFASEDSRPSRDEEPASEEEDLEGSEGTSSSGGGDGDDAEEPTEEGKIASLENEAEDDEEIALDDRDDISIDEDAVPKQKVIIDNKV